MLSIGLDMVGMFSLAVPARVSSWIWSAMLSGLSLGDGDWVFIIFGEWLFVFESRTTLGR